MDNLIIVAIILLVVLFAGLYIYRAKKIGKKCIGCPGDCSKCQHKN